MSKFNERMRYIKDFTGITQLEFARRIGIPSSTIAYYFKDREASYDVLMRIAKVFNVSVNWLIGFVDEDKEELANENARLRDRLKQINELSKTL